MHLRIFVVFLTLAANLAFAQVKAFGQRVRQPGSINLPYNVTIGENTWTIQHGGWFQQQGNQPIFGQAANITVNGQGVQGNMHRAALDKKTNELVLEGMNIAGLSLTRRIFFSEEENYCRYIDVFTNRGATEVAVQLMMQTSLNFGINAGNLVTDPKRDTSTIGWIAQTGAGPSVLEWWAGNGSKVTPEVQWQQGNSFVQPTYRFAVPPKATVAIAHVHGIHGTAEAAEQFVRSREGKLFQGVPPEIRKAIINFRAGGMMLGDREMLRGETLDVVELRTGDQLRGTLSAKSYTVQTSFGDIEVPAEKVIGMLTAGSFKPRQLLVTRDGEIIGGTLKGDTIALELSSGQTTAVPLSQVNRVGYRKGPDEVDEVTFTKSMVLLRTGDRLAFFPPAEPVNILTRFGRISLPMDQFASIDLRGTESAAHIATLNDGSRFGGLLENPQLQLKLATSGQTIPLPIGAIAMIQNSAETPEIAATSTSLKLAGGDELAAELTGVLKLDTAFDTLTINADEITAVAPLKESGFDIQVTLWDQTTVSGQLTEPALQCKLGETTLSIPLALLEQYRQPNPRPSRAVENQIKAIVSELNAEDFKQRESAEAKLVTMGEIVIPILRQLRDAQPLEAQQRIDSVLKKVQK